MNLPSHCIVLFTPHASRYGDDRDGFHSLLEQKWIKGYDFVDLSIPRGHQVAGDDREVERQLFDRMSLSDVVTVLSGVYASHSDWMATEATFANVLRKPALRIALHGQKRVSALVASDVTRWRGESIRRDIVAALPEDRRVAFQTVLGARSQMEELRLRLRQAQINANRPYMDDLLLAVQELSTARLLDSIKRLVA